MVSKQQRVEVGMFESETMRGPGRDWLGIVRKNGSEGFSRALAEDVVLDSSVMNGSCVGVDAVGALFAATSGMYDRIAFTHETVDRLKTYLEWEGQAFDMNVAGSTIITRDGSGLIQSIRLYHRPLHLVVRFSAELGRRLDRKADPALS
jgi:hypothetical protein